MTIELRGLRDKEWEAWFSGLEWAFGGGVWAPEERALWRELTEIDRSIAAWDGDRIVGSFGSFSFRMTVPGGAVVPTAGVTAVSVAATHRRRGLLRRMMRSALEDIHAAGEPLAVLTASEQQIYGRFGYGVATRAMRASIDTARVRIAPPAGADDLTLSVLPPAEAAARCEELYARLVPTRPGMLARQPGWEKLPLLDPPADRNGASELRCVLAERNGELMGYARYAMKPHWGEGAIPDGTVLVRDLTAADPAAYGALLRFLFETDLMSTVVLSNRPVDDPLLHLVSDIRRCDLRIVDRLHLRTVDVGAALAARTYATEVDVVLAVEDEFCPWNTGNWRLSGGPLGAVCERTTDPAELSFDVRALGAAYLGDASPLALAGAGLVRELRGGALGPAATAFSSAVAPWLPHGF